MFWIIFLKIWIKSVSTGNCYTNEIRPSTFYGKSIFFSLQGQMDTIPDSSQEIL